MSAAAVGPMPSETASAGALRMRPRSVLSIGCLVAGARGATPARATSGWPLACLPGDLGKRRGAAVEVGGAYLRRRPEEGHDARRPRPAVESRSASPVESRGRQRFVSMFFTIIRGGGFAGRPAVNPLAPLGVGPAALDSRRRLR